MRFMVDESTGPCVANWLRDEGHEVFSVYEEARGADDDDLIEKAFAESWILVTNDKEFGEIVRRRGRPHKGLILLRLRDERSPNKIGKVRRLLEEYSRELPNNFVVVTETRVRFARK